LRPHIELESEEDIKPIIFARDADADEPTADPACAWRP